MAPARLGTRQKALLAALLVAHGLLAWQLRVRGIFTFGDDAAYILLSRSLRAFTYREPQFVGNPVAARFPPGYPAFLAVVNAPAGEHLWLISLAGIAVSMLGLVFLFDTVRRRWSSDLAFLAVAATAVNPVILANAGNVASETLFTTMTLGSLWAAARAEPGDKAGSMDRRSGILAGALAIAAAVTRSAGVTLPLALGAHWLFRRRYRWVVTLAIATTMTVGAWLAWTVVAPGRQVRRSYIDDAVNVRTADGSVRSTIVHRLKTNATAYVGQSLLTELTIPVTRRTRMDNVAWVFVLGTLAVAGFVSAWRRWNAAAWYVLAYSALLMVWAYTLERFLDPLVPFIIAMMIIGAGMARWAVRPALQRAPAIVVAMGLACFALVDDARLVDRAGDCERARVDCSRPVALDYLDAVAYLAARSPDGARVVTPKAPTLFYHAHRQALYWDEVITQHPDSFDGLLRRDSVSYILTTPVFSDHLTLVRLSLHNCGRLDLVRAFSPETLLLAVRPASAPLVDGGRACVALARAKDRAEDHARRGIDQ